MSKLLMSEFERAARTVKAVGTVLFLGSAGVALIAASNRMWHFFGTTAFVAMIGLGFRIEGAVREEVARHAPGGSDARFPVVPAAKK